MQNLTFFEKFNLWIRNSITIKLLSIGILILIMLIPTNMIESLISERQYTREAAINEVSSKWGEAQTVTGPILTVPFYTYHTEVKDEKRTIIKVKEYAHFLPNKIKIEGIVNPEIRYRGIYEVVLYNSILNFSGEFPSPDLSDWKIEEKNILWDEAFVSLGIPDMRGIKEKIVLNWSRKKISFKPGTGNLKIIEAGLHTKVNIKKTDSIKSSYPFNFSLNLNGSKSLNFIPVGKETLVELESDWDNPSFNGAFLPNERSVTKEGFTAKWKVFDLNRNYPQKWTSAITAPNFYNSSFGFDLRLPVDQYQKSIRSAKYGVMFIVLTFLIFFFVEIKNKKRIHPFQYILVGLAISVFYTLLLALSEHIGFNLAYLVAALGIIGLITTYSISIFRDNKLSGIMFGILVVLFIFMFTIIQMQDYALLMGSIGIFIVLSVVMYLSKNIDWYTSSEKKEPE